MMCRILFQMSIHRVIVIVGASSGIGAGLAQCLSNDAKIRSSPLALVLVARRETELINVADRVRNEYCSILTLPMDVTQRINIERILHETDKQFHSISCWINNVGLGISRSVLDLTDQDIDTMISVNVKTALYGMQVAIPYFRQQGYGHLINMSSILGRVPYTTFRSMYSASKAVLNSLTTNLRMELQADSRCEKIFVTTILPGMVKTDFALNVIGDSPPTSLADYKVPFLGPFPRTTQSVDDVCEIICQVINSDCPPREVYTNVNHEPLVKEYFDNVADFELRLKPPSTT
jgi:short-subunit dehydrogenase